MRRVCVTARRRPIAADDDDEMRGDGRMITYLVVHSVLRRDELRVDAVGVDVALVVAVRRVVAGTVWNDEHKYRERRKATHRARQPVDDD